MSDGPRAGTHVAHTHAFNFFAFSLRMIKCVNFFLAAHLQIFLSSNMPVDAMHSM